MDEKTFRTELNQLSFEYPNQLQEYDNEETWVENKVISFKNRNPGPWNGVAAKTEFNFIEKVLKDGEIA